MTAELANADSASETKQNGAPHPAESGGINADSASDLDRTKLTAKHGRNFKVAYSVSESYFARDIVKNTSLAPFMAKLCNPALCIVKFKEEPRASREGTEETTLATVELARLTDPTRAAYTYTYVSRPYIALCKSLALDPTS